MIHSKTLTNAQITLIEELKRHSNRFLFILSTFCGGLCYGGKWAGFKRALYQNNGGKRTQSRAAFLQSRPQRRLYEWAGHPNQAAIHQLAQAGHLFGVLPMPCLTRQSGLRRRGAWFLLHQLFWEGARADGRRLHVREPEPRRPFLRRWVDMEIQWGTLIGLQGTWVFMSRGRMGVEDMALLANSMTLGKRTTQDIRDYFYIFGGFKPR